MRLINGVQRTGSAIDLDFFVEEAETGRVGEALKQNKPVGGFRQACSIKKKRVGSDLLFQPLELVPSAQRGLTTLFGKGRGDPPRCSHQHIFKIKTIVNSQNQDKEREEE